MPYSHHSHSGQFCKHAQGTLEDVVREAVRQRFQVYGLTEHVPRYRMEDFYPEEINLSLGSLRKQFDDFLDEAHRLKRVYDSKVELLVGLETEYITCVDLDELGALLERQRERIEYIVGSVHHVNAIPIDFDRQTYERAVSSFGDNNHDHALSAFLESYFDAQYTLMHRFHPEIIGHMDLCRLYTPFLRFQEYPRALEKLERNVCFGTEYGALFEVNAAAFRKGWDEAYPGGDVIEIIKKHRGRFAISDDSHGPRAVGMNYGRLREYLRKVGVDELWTLERCEGVENVGGRCVRPRKVNGCWWEHEFWEGL